MKLEIEGNFTDVVLDGNVLYPVSSSSTPVPPPAQMTAVFKSTIINGADVITYQVTQPGIDVRYLQLEGFLVAGNGKEGTGLKVTCPLNTSWIYGSVLRDVEVEGCGGVHGLWLNGSVFESSLFNVCSDGNRQNGVGLSHDAAGGEVSALAIFGGTHRKNGMAGIAAVAGARDFKCFGTYFVENKGQGIWAEQGFTLLQGCGFENNGGVGVQFQNYGHMIGCTGSSFGPQVYLAQGYLAGDATIMACEIEGYSGFEAGIKLAKMDGNGTLTVSASKGTIDAAATVTVKTL